MKKIIFSGLSVLLLAPNFCFAEEGVKGLIQTIEDILKSLVPVLVGIAIVVFVWGLVVFIKSSGNEDAKDEGKRKMIWGIIAIFVIVSIWGIVGFIGESIGITSQDNKAQTPKWPD